MGMNIAADTQDTHQACTGKVMPELLLHGLQSAGFLLGRSWIVEAHPHTTHSPCKCSPGS